MAELGNKEVAAATTGMVTEESWINFIFLTKPPAGTIERKAQPMTAGMISKERVPDSFIDILKKRPQSIPEAASCQRYFPSQVSRALHDLHLSTTARRNYCIDLHEDVLRQYAEKGFAELGVDFTHGIKKISILPFSPSSNTK